jgi:hypothetical protein
MQLTKLQPSTWAIPVQEEQQFLVASQLGPTGSFLSCSWPQANVLPDAACQPQHTHHMYDAPMEFRPDRFMPGGEYDSFDEARRLFMFVPFIQVRCADCCDIVC